MIRPRRLRAGSETLGDATSDTDKELLRLRDRFHAFAQTVSRRIGELQAEQRLQRRDLDRLERQLDELREDLDELTRTDEIASAVRTAVATERQQRWTLPKRIGAVGVALFALVPAAHELALWVAG